MFDPRVTQKHLVHKVNWESGIHDVVVEACDSDEDPSGYRATFYTANQNNKKALESYSIGASLLSHRLNKLNQAGFDAPMTKKAINMIDQKRIKLFNV